MTRKTTYLILLISLFLLGCNQSNKIEIKANTFQSGYVVKQIPEITITIDTINKTIVVPIHDNIQYEESFPYYDSKNKEIRLSIISSNTYGDEPYSTRFNVTCQSDTFRCLLSADSVFIIIPLNANEIGFYHLEEKKIHYDRIFKF